MEHVLKNKVRTLVSAVGISLIFLAGCGRENGQEAAKTADLVYVNWAEGVAYTHLAKTILEERMGYDVTITPADVGASYTAVAAGDKDAFMETWLPVLHKDYLDEYGDDLIDLGHVYEDTQSGLVVPAYVDIDKISELNDNADKFDNEIIGIDAGAGIMKTTKKLIDEYGLKLDLRSSSGPAMTVALKNAISSREWIVVTGWKPHWMWGRWDLKFLEQDPDNMMWKPGNIHIMGREGLKRDKPELAAFLENMRFTDEQLADLMLQVKTAGDDVSVEDVVAQWMDEHSDLIDQWIPAKEETGTSR